LKKKLRKEFAMALCLLAGFALWTAAVSFVDVAAIGPEGSTVGFATVNGFFHDLTGVHMFLYTVTDWLGLVPLCVILGFGLLGLIQWIRRKCLRQVDASILILGGFYLAVMAVYLFFETVVVNYRPVLIAGILEASYPSSTTMLVMCVMPTGMMQFQGRIKNRTLRGCVIGAMGVFSLFMVIGRLASGVHWLTDIVGGALLSGGLVLLYDAICKRTER